MANSPVDGTRARHARRWPAVAWLVASALLIVWHLVLPHGVLADITYLVVASGAVAAAWIGVRRATGASRRVAVLVATGVTLASTGDLIFILYRWIASAPDVSVADVPWLAAYVVLGAALFLLLLGGERGNHIDPDGAIDVAAVLTIGLLVAWGLWIGPTAADAAIPASTRFVWVLYPVLDMVLLALVLRALFSRARRAAIGALLGLGVACWLLADVAFLAVTSNEVFTAWIDAGWLAGAVLLAASTFRNQSRRINTARPASADAVGLGRVAIGFVPLLVPALIEVVGNAAGDAPSYGPLMVATIVLVALAFARAARLVQSDHRTRALLRSAERYSTALAVNSSDAVIVIDADRRVLNESPQLATLLGRASLGTQGLDALRLLAPTDIAGTLAAFESAQSTPGQVFETEMSVRHGAGHVIWLDIRLVDMLADPDVAGLVINVHEITDRKRAQDELAHQAFHDVLTGLANRALFRDRVDQALRRNARTAQDPALIYLDLDGFKNVNDSLGHESGDRMLQEIARRLVDAVRPGDSVARLGGDEFAILIESSHSVDEAEAVADRILEMLALPVQLGDHQVTLSASLGIAAGDADSTASSLLRDADVAMYRAKGLGKAQRVLFNPEMRTAIVERLQLDNDLMAALDRKQFRLVYQPVVELESERIVGFEALLRWDHPTLGTVMPDRFIAIAEENGLIVPIGAWVLNTACDTVARWHRQYPTQGDLTMAVNISARQLASSDLERDVAGALARTGVRPGAIVLEMTETALVQDTTVAAARLHELRALGVRLAIDDFGTGYSSLSYLRKFPVDILKIDRSFINTITERDQVPAIVRGLLDLGRTLDLETVAEGIESDVQRGSLQGEHCALGQGFLFARPMDADEAERLLTHRAAAGDVVVQAAAAP
jgi:diguanylate cyclase (GGDEF)-like protein/PAS domain S-box-containing protein